MNVLNKINKGLYEGEKAIAIVSFISMMGVMFLQVFFRYVIKSSIAWTEEAMRYLFVISSFFGAACCTYEGKHVVIDFLGTILEKCVKMIAHVRSLMMRTVSWSMCSAPDSLFTFPK